jgi:membrane fusion protein, multidrug efflux system
LAENKISTNSSHGRGWQVAFWLLLGLVTLVMLVLGLHQKIVTTQKDARLVHLPIPVQTAPATVRTISETIGASGITQPYMPVTLTAKVTARVLNVPIDLGHIVHPGQVLVELDPKLYQANLRSAQVALENAKNELQRLTVLAGRNFASEVELEQARATEVSDYSNLVNAEINLANCRIESPVTGVVLQRMTNPGETPKLDDSLVEIGVLDPILMDASVSEDKIGFVYVGMEGDVGTDAVPGRTFHGTVYKIDGEINDTTRTFGAYIRIPNHDLLLKKGVTGYARLHSSRMVLTVPSSAIVNPIGDHARVFVIGSDGRAHLREVRTGISTQELTEVMSGLTEGEQVVAVGQFDLHENEKVEANRFAPWNK